MKNTFTINVLFVLFYLLFHMCGVFGVDQSVSVMEGDSVTLHSDVTDIQSYYMTLWRFGDDGFTIAQINKDKIIYSDIPAFTDRMVLNDQTGSLTITNSRIKHSGLYKMEISNSIGTSVKKFHLKVYNSQFLIEAEKGELKTVSVTEGDPAYLMMEDVEIQSYDLIVWRFGDDGILIVKDDREDNKTTFTHDEIYVDRLELNYQTGSLTITDARITDTGLYKVKIIGRRRTEYMRFILTVSASGISSGGVAGIVIVVLLVASGAVGVFVFFYRRRTSEIKKQNDVFVDKSVSMKTGDSVILHTGVREIQKDDEITWMFEDTSIAKMKGDQTIENIDDRFKDKLELNPQTGSLIIKDTQTEHTGLYKVKMRLQDQTSAQMINVSSSDKLSVNEGDPFTLSSGHTELGDNVMTWRFKDKHIATVSEHQTSVCDEERFKDRVHVDPQTGSLTVKNSRTEDSGLYQLQINTEKSERKFTVSVREKFRKVSVMEGDSFTLNTGVAFIQRPDMIKWMFKHKSIAELIGKRHSDAAVVDKDERFTDRLELDYQTGSLTVKNTRTTDSGLYTLKINSEDSEWKFSVTVKGWLPWEKRPEQIEVNEEDPFTLSSGQTELGDNVMTWRFKDKHIVTVSEHQTSVCDEERFKDRVHVDPQTGSLTITNSKTKDSGLYQLQISTEKSKRKFTVRVRENIKVSVMEGESFTLNTLIQGPEMIQWMFSPVDPGDKCIAAHAGNTPAAAAADVDKDKRFTDRLELDHQTGSLTVTNTRTTDSGLYTLKIGFEDSEWKFSVTVKGRPPRDKRPEQKEENTPEESNLQESPIREEVKTDKLSVNEGDPFTLNSGQTELGDNVMTWRFKDKHIATVSEHKTSVCDEERFKDRVHVDPQTGSLTVTNSKTKHSGLYQLKISTEKSERKFTVTVRDKLSVNEGDPFTLSSGQTEQGDNVMIWRFKDKHIATVSEHQASVSDEERFKDRVHVDPQTGSLTVTNSRTEDSGLYKLKISGKKKLKRKFTVSVRENIKVSVMEGESFTLNTLIQRPEMIQWMFGDKCIAEHARNTPAAAAAAAAADVDVDVDVDDRFTDRLKLDHQTGSLTVTNTRITDSGLYTLKIDSEDSEWKFSVTVSSRRPLDKRPEQIEESTENTPEESKLLTSQDSPIRAEQTDKLSVNEGDPFTLNSGQNELGDKVMTWRFKDKHIATVSEHQAPVCDEERFKDRVHVDPQTGSLTVTNSKTKDSGLYQLKISTEKSKRKFTVKVHENIRKVSVMERDSFTLNTGNAFTQRPDMIKWMFKHKCIAEHAENRPAAADAAAVDKDERFTDRLELDHQTGSLTVTNTRTTDSGCYTLKINSEDSEWKFIVTVSKRSKKTKGNHSGTAQISLNESRPLLRGVADDKEEMSLQEHPV
ncbi:uncharacterized protein LOC130430568 isoform X2 [Triplophysa dalaica]|uniref:uncharacterized protein LOC130430568 isoform X2 n=1 Tax=Triplophysa dalaica TaxID=1582913 RepID=UPI0024E03AB0|nr:uncharacterized protein LOC130430568 isoform X2 [Triplophysa dalaica]